MPQVLASRLQLLRSGPSYRLQQQMWSKRLHAMLVESRLPGSRPVPYLAVAGDGEQSRIDAARPERGGKLVATHAWKTEVKDEQVVIEPARIAQECLGRVECPFAGSSATLPVESSNPRR